MLIYSSNCRVGPIVEADISTSNCAAANNFALDHIKADPPDVLLMSSNSSFDIDYVRKFASMVKSYGVKHVLTLGQRPHWRVALHKIVLDRYWASTPRYIPELLDENMMSLTKVFQSQMRPEEPFEFVDEVKPFCSAEGCLAYLGESRRDGLITADSVHLQPRVCLRNGDDGSQLGLTARWYSYTREYSPSLLEKTPFRFAEQSALGRAVQYLRVVNRDHRRKLGVETPTDFLPPRWRRHVLGRSARGESEISRPHYELALLTTLNEQLESGDVTVAHSRRWTDFEDYLIPRATWLAERAQHYAALGLPIDSDIYLTQLEGRLHAITAAVDARAPDNSALTIDRGKGEYHLARLKASSAHDAAKGLNDLFESRMPEVELIDALIDVDNDTDFLHHFLQSEQGRRLPPAIQRRNVLAALLAVGCNIGPTVWPQPPVSAFGRSAKRLTWYLTADALKAAGIDLVNYAIHVPISHLYGLGDTCSADGMRFYVPVDILAADFSHLLHGRGVTLYAHTGENAMRLYQEPIPCRLREATFVLDGLMEHETELDPRTVYTDTHGYTEVVMATADLLGKSLAPRIARMHEQTLYKLDRSRRYAHLDPILDGTVKPHLVPPRMG